MEKLIEITLAIVTHKRMLSLYWRIADMFAVVMADVLLEVLTGANTPQVVVVFVGLALGELTKYLNKKVE